MVVYCVCSNLPAVAVAVVAVAGVVVVVGVVVVAVVVVVSLWNRYVVIPQCPSDSEYLFRVWSRDDVFCHTLEKHAPLSSWKHSLALSKSVLPVPTNQICKFLP